MSDIAITVENLGKEYRIGSASQRPDTLRDAIAGRLRGRRDHRPSASERGTIDHGPSSIVHGPSDGPSSMVHRPAPETFWALKDVSFEVHKGEVVGIIGRNGAGKSTLLKILSRITEPTAGRAVIHGRVGSLLEVGTGFHPELTGRENIYLNGAVLGMRRAEIDRRFDEIVAFSEIERFLDTPVKRYSSGMYVRLAFAVAAHLEPEVLIVDEVLAVGDAAFQKKCLGKMGDVAGEGRTVIFVSHNMAAVRGLCERAVLLSSGSVFSIGPTDSIIADYTSQLLKTRAMTETDTAAFHREPIEDSPVVIGAVWVENKAGARCTVFDMEESFAVQILLRVSRKVGSVNISFTLKNDSGQRVVLVFSLDKGFEADLEVGEHVVQLEVAGLGLSPGQYLADLGINRSAWTKAFDVVCDIPLMQVRKPDWLAHWANRPWGSIHWGNVEWSIRDAEPSFRSD